MHILYLKNQIFKKIFYKGNFKTRLCTSMTNFKVVGKKQSSYMHFTFCVFLHFWYWKIQNFKKINFLKLMVMYVHDKFQGFRSKNNWLMFVLHFVCFMHFWYWKIWNLKKYFFKGNFLIMLCTFMTNFKVAGSKMTKLKLFYVLCIFCIFSNKKVKISKKKYFLKATL